MRLEYLKVSGYRSLRNVRIPLRQTTVVVGPNGTGKSNLYRSLYLLCQAAGGRFAQAVADEGGMQSILWAGARKRGPERVEWDIRLDDWDYAFVCGLPEPGQSPAFSMDPWMKEERLAYAPHRKRPIQFMERDGPSVTLRDIDGNRVVYPFEMPHTESVLSEVRDSIRFPELEHLRDHMSHWRFYHQFRADAESPIRQARVGVTTPILAHDGRDLAAALKTVERTGNVEMLRYAVDRAFPKGRLLIDEDERGRVAVALELAGVQRPMEAHELSDGTLRYLCLVAALLTPRPPAFMALNEPETSLHPDLLGPLGRLIAHASSQSQLWVTTHSQELAQSIAELTGDAPIELEMVEGETKVVGQSLLD